MAVLRHLAAETRSAFASGWGPYADGTIPPPGWEGSASTAGQRVTVDTSLQLIDAYACIGLLEDSISQLPIDTFRRDDANVRTPIDPTQLIAQPDPEIEQWTWVARAVGSLATAGDVVGYLYDRDRRGYPQRCTLINPEDAQPVRASDGRIQWRIRSATLGHATLPASEILHIPLVTLPGRIKGLSPIEASRRGIGLAMATEEFGARWFGEGASPSSVLQSDQKIDDEEAKRVQARWVASHGGSRRPAVLSGGLEWKSVQIAPNESQFLETRKLNTAQIARIWRVPPHMIGDVERSTSWGSGIEEQGIGYVVYTLGAYVHRIEKALSSPKISPRGQYAKFNVSALLRGNTKDRFLSYAIARQWGWMSTNDIRALEDLPPIEGGDTYLQPLNMIDAEKALQVLLADKQPVAGGGA